MLNILPRPVIDMCVGGVISGASLFTAVNIFQAAKTIGFSAYLISERGYLLTYSPLGALMTISIIAKLSFDRLKFLHTGNSNTNNFTILTVAFLSTSALHSAMEHGSLMAGYLLTGLTVAQLGLGFFCGIYLLFQSTKGLSCLL